MLFLALACKAKTKPKTAFINVFSTIVTQTKAKNLMSSIFIEIDFFFLPSIFFFPYYSV